MTGPCTRPECGGETHTDGWGTPIQCPHGDGILHTSRPIDHLMFKLAPASSIAINGEHGRPLVTIHPNGELEYGPGYTPDEAARRFWDALRRLTPARCPNCGHIGMETP